MDIDRIVEELKRERARIDAAIAALGGVQPGRRGRPPGSGRRRRMSAAARRRISAAMKQRWAERKKRAA